MESVLTNYFSKTRAGKGKKKYKRVEGVLIQRTCLGTGSRIKLLQRLIFIDMGQLPSLPYTVFERQAGRKEL